ncbi:MAG TPA: tRNA (N(6)-L-threonylcarbamoyladenosine(37)-C(2))-methylthiotransferase MtaB [Dehalococcoidia bacterium]|nr:tRNA (N(6)-L-threonylcarbamoyladenosine(37)-C(2))-methylthiotransferase MtaB [Dehalococcoidia bacterium]
MATGRERRTVALDTVGCKLNQAETELMAKQFADAGYQPVTVTGEADVYILNTCTVTHIADRKCRQRLRLVRRQNPGALIIATGCYAERAHQEIARIAGVDLIAGNKHKPHLVKLVEKTAGPGGPATSDACSGDYIGPRTRAFVKVQDGCNSSCAYCIVPLVRGGESSLPADQIIVEVKHRVSLGYQDVVLTGTKVGSYRYDGVGLAELLQRILSETGVNRLRLSSLQPPEISPVLVALWRDRRLCRHFHLSLQSGSDSVLRRMKRVYTTGEYQRAVSLLREMVPEAAITTDIITGFPGETAAEFEQSYELCRRLDFARIHVFPYSPRSGTGAARLPQPVAASVKRARSERMLALAAAGALSFRWRFLSRKMSVLWEKRAADGVWSGLTENYIKVYTRSDEDLTNQLLPVTVTEMWGDGVWGSTDS